MIANELNILMITDFYSKTIELVAILEWMIGAIMNIGAYSDCQAL